MREPTSEEMIEGIAKGVKEFLISLPKTDTDYSIGSVSTIYRGVVKGTRNFLSTEIGRAKTMESIKTGISIAMERNKG